MTSLNSIVIMFSIEFGPHKTETRSDTFLKRLLVRQEVIKW